MFLFIMEILPMQTDFKKFNSSSGKQIKRMVVVCCETLLLSYEIGKFGFGDPTHPFLTLRHSLWLWTPFGSQQYFFTFLCKFRHISFPPSWKIFHPKPNANLGMGTKKQFCMAIGHHWKPSKTIYLQIRELFKLFDSDNDGKISKDDFVTCLRRNPLLIALFARVLSQVDWFATYERMVEEMV